MDALPRFEPDDDLAAADFLDAACHGALLLNQA
jgi:hypothetical protein